VTFNNFSIANIKDRSTWSPLPQGDGQKLSVRVQSNSRFFRSYNFSFTEPWLGGKKPNSFTVGAVHSALDYELLGSGKLNITRLFAGLGTQLRWPDDFFSSNTTLNVEFISLDDYQQRQFFVREDNTGDFIPITDGTFKNFSITQTITRSSVSDPLFPRRGSRVSLSLQLTPPYSLFRKDGWDELSVEETAEIVASCNFEDGPVYQCDDAQLNNALTGTEIIALRGYDENEINGGNAGTVYNKITAELRYPLSLNPNSTIYVKAFAQGGNAWDRFSDFNPYDMNKSVGVGMRVFLPMFGLLGFDYGWGFDKDLAPGASLGDYAQFNIVLGFEPE